MRLCFATNNRHKLQEVQGMLGGEFILVTLEDIGCREELREDQDTFEGNSLQKASYVFDHYRIPAFADDSGLCVDALNGEPGVRSARYAGPLRNDDDNIDLLLKNLSGINSRLARFRTVITLVDGPSIHQFDGTIHGQIIHGRRGIGGFGYDSVFVADGLEKTFAEMSNEEKNKISHRALAIGKLVDFLRTKRPVPSGHE